MDLTIEILENIYKNYGFEVKREDDDIACFLYKKGRYFGVDIVQLNREIDLTEKINKINSKKLNEPSGFNIESFLHSEIQKISDSSL